MTGTGRDWTIICNPTRIELPPVTVHRDARIIDEEEASLNEIFVAHAGGN